MDNISVSAGVLWSQFADSCVHHILAVENSNYLQLLLPPGGGRGCFLSPVDMS